MMFGSVLLVKSLCEFCWDSFFLEQKTKAPSSRAVVGAENNGAQCNGERIYSGDPTVDVYDHNEFGLQHPKGR